MAANKSKSRREKKAAFIGPMPAKKLLTTRGLIIRGIIFTASIAGVCYLLWEEFSR